MITIKIADGRELGLVPVTPHEAMGVAEGCRHLSGVRQWWRMAMAVASIRSIDGIPIPIPSHEKHVEGMVGRFSRQDLKEILAAIDHTPETQPAPVLEFRELSALETLRVWGLIGELETIAGWVAPAFIAATVRKLGDEIISLPSTKDEMRGLVLRLGAAGMSSASTFVLAQRAKEKAAEADRQVAAKN